MQLFAQTSQDDFTPCTLLLILLIFFHKCTYFLFYPSYDLTHHQYPSYVNIPTQKKQLMLKLFLKFPLKPSGFQ